MEFAKKQDAVEVYELYRNVIEKVNESNIKLGWNIKVYPDIEFINTAIDNNEMCIIKDNNKIIAAAVVNHTVNDEYNLINWKVKEPKENIATIHALATDPDYRGSKISYKLLKEIEEYCKLNGDKAIHLDVIDTNIPAYKLYIRNGYTEVDCIKMFYEVVGTREFWMMEHEL